MKDVIVELYGFLYGLSKANSEILCFTTFTLDEAVLVALLKKYGVNKNQRIVVFHDVLRHRTPGYLRAHFPNSIVYTVVLKGAGSNCPVFHSKLWMRIERKQQNYVIKRLAVTSANISRFHLADNEGSKTFESFNLIDDCEIKLPSNSFVFDKLKKEKKGHERLEGLKPETILVDIRRKDMTTVRRETKTVEALLKEIGETPEMFAAPFINGKKIKELFGENITDKAFIGSNKKGEVLHAKLIAFEKTCMLGSVNLTSQALGLKGTINHEVVLLKTYGADEFKKFEKFDKYDLNGTLELPADEDQENPIENWLEERNEKINAPEGAELKITGGKAYVTLPPKFTKGNVYVGNRKDETKLKLYRSKLRFDTSQKYVGFTTTKKDERKFAEILKEGSVKVSGKRETKAWSTELNYGNYWIDLETLLNTMSSERSGSEKTRNEDTGATRVESEKFDVRDMRKLALDNPNTVERDASLINFFHKTKIIESYLPEWCIKLAKARGANKQIK